MLCADVICVLGFICLCFVVCLFVVLSFFLFFFFFFFFFGGGVSLRDLLMGELYYIVFFVFSSFVRVFVGLFVLFVCLWVVFCVIQVQY